MMTNDSGIKIHGSLEDSKKNLSNLKPNSWTEVEVKGLNTGGDEGKIIFVLNDLPKNSVV